MKRKGFTLIELLAVIVVLAIIALISAPIIIKVIERARKGAFEDSAYGVASAAKLYFADASFDGKVDTETFTFPEDTKLKLSGERPKSGSVKVDENGKVEMAISNGVWCALKSKDEEKVRITDYSIDECEIGVVPSTDTSCFEVNETGETITDYICDDKDVVIPKKINGVEITHIGGYIFYQRQLTNVEIPDSVTHIERDAFCGNQLTSVELPTSVTDIGDDAFFSNQLTSITIPSSVMNIGENAFRENQLRDLTIQDGVVNIKKFAFNDNQLIDINIPSSVTSIGEAAFNNNQLPDNKAFIYARDSNGAENKRVVVSYGGVKRDNIIIPDSIINIGPNAFYSCQLSSIKISENVTDIGEWAFSSNQLASVIIPNRVTSIGNYAFSDNSLTDVIIGNRVTSIGDYAFQGNQLTEITIPESVTSIGEAAFFQDDASGLKIIVNKPANSITGSPWGASSVEWTG